MEGFAGVVAFVPKLEGIDGLLLAISLAREAAAPSSAATGEADA